MNTVQIFTGGEGSTDAGQVFTCRYSAAASLVAALLVYIDERQRERAAGREAWLVIDGERMSDDRLAALIEAQLDGDDRDTAEYLLDLARMSSRDPLGILA